MMLWEGNNYEIGTTIKPRSSPDLPMNKLFHIQEKQTMFRLPVTIIAACDHRQQGYRKTKGKKYFFIMNSSLFYNILYNLEAQSF